LSGFSVGWLPFCDPAGNVTLFLTGLISARCNNRNHMVPELVPEAFDLICSRLKNEFLDKDKDFE